MNMKARVLIGLVFVALVVLGFYIAGFNFNERGEDAARAYIFSVLAFIAGIACPLFDD